MTQEAQQVVTPLAALKLALEALELHGQQYPHMVKGYCLDAITAIKEALAQTQEPVAHWSDCAVHSEPAYPKGECDCGGFATPPQRTWVGLTDENLRKLADEHLFYQPEGYEVSGVFAFARAIEAKLKQKNGYADENT